MKIRPAPQHCLTSRIHFGYFVLSVPVPTVPVLVGMRAPSSELLWHWSDPRPYIRLGKSVLSIFMESVLPTDLSYSTCIMSATLMTCLKKNISTLGCVVLRVEPNTTA